TAIERKTETFGTRTVHFLSVSGPAEFSFVDFNGAELRFTATLLPQTIRIKGLNCFVAPRGGKPGPAGLSTIDGSLDFVAGSGRRVGAVAWTFGKVEGDTRVFSIDDVRIPLKAEGAHEAVAIHLGYGGDVFVVAR